MSIRSVTVRSFAKINLDLRVLHRRADGFHELRTVFQTISLADTIHIEYERARETRISVESNLDIPDNLVVRAARAVLDAASLTARIAFRLKKRIPLGAGLGGGSSNAASVLLALPVLAGARIPPAQLAALGAGIGSDVPFFLFGGAALGIGRGTEIYPLPDPRVQRAVLVAPGIHVSTAEAYRDLQRGSEAESSATLTRGVAGSDTDNFQSVIWALAEDRLGDGWKVLCANDFESAVFRRHPVLERILTRFGRLGARPARMTGSGSALFGLFDSTVDLERAYASLVRQGGEAWDVFRIATLSRRRYQSFWRGQLAAHVRSQALWPPRSRYSQK